jgi:pimeloyl-ACP methyl ester carboxylesterase
MDKNQDSQRKSKTLHKPLLVLNVYRLIFRYVGALFPSLIGRWAHKLWFQTHRSPTLKRELEWLASAKSEAVDINGLKVMTYYWESRENKNAPLVMLVHGWTGRGSQMGGFAEPLVKAGFRVLSFDSHAHGLTEGKTTTIFKQSEVQRGLAKKFGPIYAVVGHSFGGMVTAYSLSHGMETQKAVCISPPARFDFLLERFSKTLHLPKNIQHYMIARFKEEFGEDLLERVSSTTTSKTLGHIPTLIIHDEDDKDVPISEGELLHRSWPNSELKRTKDLGHRRILYNAQVIENTVNFLK